MTYKLDLKTGESIFFSVFNYHYQDIDLKNQFDIDYINIIALYEKTKIEYKLIDVLLENLRDYFIIKLPTNDLYRTNKVLLLGGIRPPSIEETNIYLKKIIFQIKEVLPQILLFSELKSAMPI